MENTTKQDTPTKELIKVVVKSMQDVKATIARILAQESTE